MRSNDLDRAIGPTPTSFDEKMRRTLRGLQEETPRHRAGVRRAVVLGVALAVVCSTAVALMSRGVKWYYDNRFTAYQQYEPERYEAIISHLQTDVEQTRTADEDIDIAVTEISWAPRQQMMVVEVTAVALDQERIELHPMENLDADGSYVGEGNLGLYPYDEEAREKHWLWTENGFGPVDEMVAPGKELLLVNCGWVHLDGDILIGDMSSMDSYVQEDGSVHIIIEVRMDFLQQDKDAEMDSGDVSLAEKLRHALQQETMTLTIPYTVTPYTEDDDALYNGGRDGEISFAVKVE